MNPGQQHHSRPYHRPFVENYPGTPPPPQNLPTFRSFDRFADEYHNDVPDTQRSVVSDEQPRRPVNEQHQDYSGYHNAEPRRRQPEEPMREQHIGAAEEYYPREQFAQYPIPPPADNDRGFQGRDTGQPGRMNFRQADLQYAGPGHYSDDAAPGPPHINPQGRGNITPTKAPLQHVLPQRQMEPQDMGTTYSPSGRPTSSEQAEVESRCKELEEALEAYHHEIEELKRNHKRDFWPFEVEEFRKFKPRNDEEYAKADEIYEKLDAEFRSLEVAADQRRKLLSLRNAYLEVQIGRKNYVLAEKLAKDTTENWRDEGAEECRLGYRLWSTALRDQGREKYQDLEGWLRTTWPRTEQQQLTRTVTLWMLENGDQLCNVLELQDRFDKASPLRNDLWNARKNTLGEWHKDTVQTGLSVARCYLKQCHLKQIAAREIDPSVSESDKANEYFRLLASIALRDIWKLWNNEQERSKAASDILTGGHMLGQLHYCRKEYDEAKTVLEEAWAARKAQSPQGLEDTILTGHYLFLTYAQLEEYSKAKLIFEEVWHTLKFVRQSTPQDSILNVYHFSMDCLRQGSTTGTGDSAAPEPLGNQVVADKGEIPKSYVEIGKVFLGDGKYQEAESILREAYNAYKTADGFGPQDDNTLSCGRCLAEAAARQGRYPQAAQIFDEMLTGWSNQGPDAEREDQVETRRLYCDLLMKRASLAGSPNTTSPEIVTLYNKVVAVLAPMKQNAFKRPEMHKCARNLLLALVRSKRFDDANHMLDEVLGYEQSVSDEILSQPFLLELGKSAMAGNQHPMAAELFDMALAAQNGSQDWDGAPEAGYSLGFCLTKQGKYHEAMEKLGDAKGRLKSTDIYKRLTNALQDAEAAAGAAAESNSGRPRGTGGRAEYIPKRPSSTPRAPQGWRFSSFRMN
jgi:tetratricopeptide (TPR) repeat protein